MDGVIVDYNPLIHGKDDDVNFASLKPIDTSKGYAYW